MDNNNNSQTNTSSIETLSNTNHASASNNMSTTNIDTNDIVLPVVNNINENIESLNNAILSLQSTIDKVTNPELTSGIIAAFVGALSAYLFNFFHWRMVQKKEKFSKTASAFCLLLNELETTSVSYWLGSYDENKESEIHTQEIIIKSKLRLINRYIIIINKQIAKQDINQQLTNFGCDIYDIASGGEFESKGRKASKDKACKISYECSDIKTLISSL